MKTARIGSCVLLVLLASWCVLRSGDAEACSCIPPPPPKEALAKSTAVFLAKVLKVEDDPANNFERRVTLQVERWWKGGDGVMLTVSTAKSSAACGYSFGEGQRYLVYANSLPKGNGILQVSLCSRTCTVAEAEKGPDLKDLGKGAAPMVKK